MPMRHLSLNKFRANPVDNLKPLIKLHINAYTQVQNASDSS